MEAADLLGMLAGGYSVSLFHHWDGHIAQAWVKQSVGHEEPLPELWYGGRRAGDRKSTRLNSSHVAISYAVFCLKKKKKPKKAKTMPAQAPNSDPDNIDDDSYEKRAIT